MSSSFALFIYLFFLQTHTVVSIKRLFIAFIIGILLTLLLSRYIWELLTDKNARTVVILKSLASALLTCGILWLVLPVPRNYLLAPISQFEVTVTALQDANTGTAQLTYQSSGLDYISPRSIRFLPDVPAENKTQSTPLIFDAENKAHLSWSGRAWREVILTFDNAIPVEILVKAPGFDQTYRLESGKGISIKIPVKGQWYYFGTGFLLFLATVLSLAMLYVVLWVKKSKLTVVTDREVAPWALRDDLLLSLITALSSVIILFVVIAGFHNRLYSDDYCYIVNLQTQGFGKALIHYLVVNNGRYSSHILDLLGFSIPTVNTLVGPLTVAVLVGSSLFFLFWQLLNQYVRSLRLRLSVAVAVVLVGSIFSVVPNLYESFVWNLHAIIVAGGFALTCINGGLFIYLLRSKEGVRRPVLCGGIFFLLGLVGAGFSEVNTVLNIVIAGIALLFVLFKKKTRRFRDFALFLLVYLFSCMIGLVVMVRVPGSSARMGMLFSAMITDVFPYFYSMVSANTRLILSANHFVALPVALALVLSGLFVGYRLPSLLVWVKKEYSFLEGVGWIFSPFLLYFVAFFPLAFFRGYFPPRTLAIPICFVLTTMFLVALAAGNRLRDYLIKGRLLHLPLAIVTIIAFVFAAIYLVGFVQNMAQSAKEWDVRQQQILQAVAHGKKDLVVAPLEHPVGTDLSTTENLWLVPCVGNYYGIDLMVQQK
jgi:hypothetical protein